METPKKVEAVPVSAYSIVKDGFLPGYVPAFRVITVTVDSKGKAVVSPSAQKYVIAEAQAIVDDKIREGCGL